MRVPDHEISGHIVGALAVCSGIERYPKPKA